MLKHNKHLPFPLCNAANVKASSTRAGFKFVQCCCPEVCAGHICNKGVVLSRPTATGSRAHASTCQICLGGYVLIHNKT